MAASPDGVVRGHRWWTGPVAALLRAGWWHTTVLGAVNVPRTGPVIVASNHIGVADGPLLCAAIPRESHMVTKQEMFDSRLGFLLRATGQVPVDRANGRAALSTCLRLLGEGRCVGIFPEGRRGRGRVESIKAGVAWLAVRSGAPVVPAACLGTRPTGASVGHVPGFRARLYVSFGTPVVLPPDLPAGRAGVEEAMRLITVAMEEHVAQASAATGVALPGDEGTRSARTGA